MAKLVDNTLKEIVAEAEFNIKNSEDLVEKLSSQTIPENYSLVSYDVESLFTNVTCQSVLEVVESCWEDIKKHTRISLVYFKRIIAFILNNSFFWTSVP